MKFKLAFVVLLFLFLDTTGKYIQSNVQDQLVLLREKMTKDSYHLKIQD